MASNERKRPRPSPSDESDGPAQGDLDSSEEDLHSSDEACTEDEFFDQISMDSIDDEEFGMYEFEDERHILIGKNYGKFLTRIYDLIEQGNLEAAIRMDDFIAESHYHIGSKKHVHHRGVEIAIKDWPPTNSDMSSQKVKATIEWAEKDPEMQAIAAGGNIIFMAMNLFCGDMSRESSFNASNMCKAALAEIMVRIGPQSLKHDPNWATEVPKVMSSYAAQVKAWQQIPSAKSTDVAVYDPNRPSVNHKLHQKILEKVLGQLSPKVYQYIAPSNKDKSLLLAELRADHREGVFEREHGRRGAPYGVDARLSMVESFDLDVDLMVFQGDRSRNQVMDSNPVWGLLKLENFKAKRVKIKSGCAGGVLADSKHNCSWTTPRGTQIFAHDANTGEKIGATQVPVSKALQNYVHANVDLSVCGDHLVCTAADANLYVSNIPSILMRSDTPENTSMTSIKVFVNGSAGLVQRLTDTDCVVATFAVEGEPPNPGDHHSLRVVDLNVGRVKSLLSGHLHSPTFCRQYCSDSNLFFSSAMGEAKVWDLRTSMPMYHLETHASLPGHRLSRDVCSFIVGVPLSDGHIAFTSGNECIRAWDLRMLQEKHLYTLSTGNLNLRGMCWHSSSQTLYVSTHNEHQIQYGRYTRAYQYGDVETDMEAVDEHAWPPRAVHHEKFFPLADYYNPNQGMLAYSFGTAPIAPHEQ